jgi:hypothetical protein
MRASASRASISAVTVSVPGSTPAAGGQQYAPSCGGAAMAAWAHEQGLG